MRLEVQCQDRIGLTRELLDILASKNIDLRGIELSTHGIEVGQPGVIYLNCPDVEFHTFSALMAQIRQINGVTDVRKIPFMPSERESTELNAILDTLPDPVISINLKGDIEMANFCALSLFKVSVKEIQTFSIFHYIPNLKSAPWFKALFGGEIKPKQGQFDEGLLRYRDKITIEGLNYLMDVMPVMIYSDSGEAILASAVIMLKPIVLSETKLTSIPDYNPLGFEHFVGVSNHHQRLISQAKKLAMLDQPLLIEGETGTGKEMLARACHNRSHRSNEPFLVLSCASMPDDAAETELFGNAAGAFNHEVAQKGIFEQADKGTVFLDEIGEMSPHLQIKLLRFLQDGSFRRVGEEKEMHVDVRVIASTKQTLSQLTQSGSFREDLYYRLNVLNLSIPSIRERSSDVLPLVDMFVAKYAQQLGLKVPSYDEDLIEQLTLYPWPGNIRQLENSVLRAMTQLDDDVLKFEHFQLPTLQASRSVFDTQSEIFTLEGSLDEMMRKHEAQILERLYQSFPSSRKLAKRLEVSHTSIANKLRDYGIRKS
ncbi:transcriptional regulator TyrR [Vibrio aphrogenes]|uniref:transcriptional regulator TyrR n=1 Tax=Vibrio aphrogenes TaxID=1891186 RepID=UPI000B35D7E5|nr:transcriptional regulator TyrR [Vibrio aphrogenes]